MSFLCRFTEVERLGTSLERPREPDNDADRGIAPLVRFDLIERRMIDFGPPSELVLR